MSTRRIVLVAAALLIAAGAFFLFVRGLSGAAASAATAEPDAAAGGDQERSGGKDKDKDKTPPGWQSFIRMDGRDTPLRPVVRSAQTLPSPFDRLSDPVPAAKSGGARREDPGLRLEGISFGAQAVALLSGRAVRVGDTVSGFRVTRIGRSAVTLAGPRGRLDLNLRDERNGRDEPAAEGGGR